MIGMNARASSDRV
jgi:hypothetical protein